MEIEGGWCGAALTPRWLSPSPRGLPPLEPGAETPRSLARLAQRTRNPLAAALAAAAASAATSAWIASKPLPPNIHVETRRHGLLDAIAPRPGEEAVLLGYMPPLARSLSRRGVRLTVVELDEELAGEARRDGYPTILGSGPDALEAVEKADIVIFTGSALEDPETLLREAGAARNARVLGLVGATSSFHPLAAERLGFNLQAGIYIDARLCPRLRAAVAAGHGVHAARVRLVHWHWARSCPREDD